MSANSACRIASIPKPTMPAPTMNPILRDVPDTIETDRLLLRCPRAGDGVAVHEAVVETLAELRAWPASLPWALAEPTVEASEIFCRQGQADYLTRTALPLLMFLKDGGQYVGGHGLHHLDWSVPKAEMGYWCRKRWHGQGLVTEAARAVAELALHTLGMRRLVCHSDAENLPSRRVAERAGFVLEGVMRHERFDPDGTPRDTCLYARVR